MKKLLLVCLLVIVLVAVSGCEGLQRWGKDIQSGTSGLSRTITLYAADGSVIATWHTQTDVRAEGGAADWIGDDGKRIIIAGTFIMTED